MGTGRGMGIGGGIGRGLGVWRGGSRGMDMRRDIAQFSYRFTRAPFGAPTMPKEREIQLLECRMATLQRQLEQIKKGMQELEAK